MEIHRVSVGTRPTPAGAAGAGGPRATHHGTVTEIQT